jgi:predicted transcriptional regulator
LKLVEERKRRREALLNLIRRNPGIDRDEAIASYSSQTGLSSKTIKTYLYELINSGLVKEHSYIDPNTLTLKAKLFPANPIHPLVYDLR